MVLLKIPSEVFAASLISKVMILKAFAVPSMVGWTNFVIADEVITGACNGIKVMAHVCGTRGTDRLPEASVAAALIE